MAEKAQVVKVGNNKVQGTKVIGGKVRFSYAKVFVPSSMDPDDPKKKYSVAILIPKSDKELVKAIRMGIKAAQEASKGKWGGKIPVNLRTPLRDGDAEKDGDEVYAGHYWMNATSPTKPKILDREQNPLTTEDEFYSGCYGRFSVNFFGYNTRGNVGVGVGLNNLQKLADGERLSGRASAEDDFDDDWKDEDDSSEENDLVG